MRKAITQALILSLAGLAGCFSAARYPSGWASQTRVPAGDCPIIDGSYHDIGESLAKKGTAEMPVRTAYSLAHLLDGWASDDASRSRGIRLAATQFDPAQDHLRVVELHLAGAELQVEATFPDGEVRAFGVRTRGRCRDSTLLLEAIEPGSDFEYGRETLVLGRANDGSLLARWSSTRVIFILGPNWASRDSLWIRFTPAGKPPGGRSGTGSLNPWAATFPPTG